MTNGKPKIVVVDYGVGNLQNAVSAVALYANVSLTSDAEEIREADGVVLPGVGSYPSGMDGLTKRGLIAPILDVVRRGVPLLGICLGAQLLLEKSTEFGETEGLGIISGNVVRFPELSEDAKIPNIGWRPLDITEEGKDSVLLDGVPDETLMFFIHSYVLQPADKKAVLATSEHGGYTFASVVRKDAVFGTQFHPEKSGKLGLRIVENFVRIVSR